MTLSAQRVSVSGKSGSRLLRNIHATLGDRLFGIPAERTCVLRRTNTKERSQKSADGILEVYQVTFPFAIERSDQHLLLSSHHFHRFSEELAGLDFKL